MLRYARVTVPVLLLAGCTGSPSSPASPATPSSPATPTPTVSAVAVIGDAAAMGATTQFTATATLSNGTTQDVTAQATWQSSDAGVATVSSGGVVTSVATGEADITATYSGVTGSQRVRVAAASAVRRTLTGVITDDSGSPITEQAEAQIMDGENAGKAGRVDANGTYSIPDVVAGTFMLRARATGYESRDHQVTLDSAETRVDFALRAERRDTPCTYAVEPARIWITRDGYSWGDIRVTTSRTGCPWTATSLEPRIRLKEVASSLPPANSITGNSTGDITILVGFVLSGGCTFKSSVQVRWAGGSSDVILQGPFYHGPPPEPPPCQ